MVPGMFFVVGTLSASGFTKEIQGCVLIRGNDQIALVLWLTAQVDLVGGDTADIEIDGDPVVR